MMNKVFPISCEDDTKRAAQWLAGAVDGGCVIGLSGVLGAGKTTFVRYFVAALGGQADQVASPSYTLEYQYPIGTQFIVEHWDLYRITELPDELYEQPSESTIRLIEWPEKVRWPEGAIDFFVKLELDEVEGLESRKLTITPGLVNCGQDNP